MGSRWCIDSWAGMLTVLTGLQIELAALMSGAPIDCWVPLDDGRSGALHIGVSLSFPLMCSSPAAVQERRSLR